MSSLSGRYWLFFSGSHCRWGEVMYEKKISLTRIFIIAFWQNYLLEFNMDPQVFEWLVRKILFFQYFYFSSVKIKSILFCKYSCCYSHKFQYKVYLAKSGFFQQPCITKAKQLIHVTALYKISWSAFQWLTKVSYTKSLSAIRLDVPNQLSRKRSEGYLLRLYIGCTVCPRAVPACACVDSVTVKLIVSVSVAFVFVLCVWYWVFCVGFFYVGSWCVKRVIIYLYKIKKLKAYFSSEKGKKNMILNFNHKTFLKFLKYLVLGLLKYI